MISNFAEKINTPDENISLKKLTKVLKGTQTTICLFCKKKFNKGSNPMKKFCSHWCKVNFVYKYEIT